MGILRRLLGGNLPAPTRDAEVLRRTEEGIALRRMKWDADARAVCAFQDDVYTSNFPDFRMTRHFMLGFEHDLRQGVADPLQGVFVLEDEDRLVGFLWVVIHTSAWTSRRYGYINNIYVVPSHRRKGLGRLLLDHADAFLREQGVVTARLTVTARNANAVDLYRQAGYQIERYEMTKRLTEPEPDGVT